MLALNQNLQKLFGYRPKRREIGHWLNVGHFAGWAGYCIVPVYRQRFTKRNLSCLNLSPFRMTKDFKKEVQSVFAKKDPSLEKVCLLNAFIGTFHGELVLAGACYRIGILSLQMLILLPATGKPFIMHLNACTGKPITPMPPYKLEMAITSR